jgi:serine protease Do
MCGAPLAGSPIVGVNGEDHDKGCRVTSLLKGGPAEKADVKVGDIITQFGGIPVKGLDQLAELVTKHKVGEDVELQLLRGGDVVKVKVKLARRM